MGQPRYLKKGDFIGIVAPARKTDTKIIDNAITIFQKWGLQVKVGENCLGNNFQFSGTDEERLTDLQTLMDDPEIKAIVAAGGGYGCIRIAGNLDFSKITDNPKWLIGFSDVTVLHNLFIDKAGLETIHGSMPVKFDDDDESRQSLESLRLALFGELQNYSINPHSRNREGEGTGRLIGGNLSILASLIGTELDIDYSDCILFIEEIDEYFYHIDRMMYSLKLSGKLKNLKGLIVGNFTDIHDNETPFGMTIEDIVLNAVSDYDFPVVFGFKAGHGKLNNAIYLNRNISLSCSKMSCNFKFH